MRHQACWSSRSRAQVAAPRVGRAAHGLTWRPHRLSWLLGTSTQACRQQTTSTAARQHLNSSRAAAAAQPQEGVPHLLEAGASVSLACSCQVQLARLLMGILNPHPSTGGVSLSHPVALQTQAAKAPSKPGLTPCAALPAAAAASMQGPQLRQAGYLRWVAGYQCAAGPPLPASQQGQRQQQRPGSVWVGQPEAVCWRLLLSLAG